MRVECRKFNIVLDIDDDKIIRFPRGLIGFADETEFVMIEREQSPRIAWLQSVKTPELALPVVSGHELVVEEEYPDVPFESAVYSENMEPVGEETALMVVLTCQSGMDPTVNLASPILVDSKTRTGAQVILQGSRFASREVLSLRPMEGAAP
jgi:flagellar assembly factor FliW